MNHLIMTNDDRQKLRAAIQAYRDRVDVEWVATQPVEKHPDYALMLVAEELLRTEPAKPRRMWINQPSTLDSLHHLHGMRVLAFREYGETYRAYLLSGLTESMQVPSLALSDGWPDPVQRGRLSTGLDTPPAEHEKPGEPSAGADPGVPSDDALLTQLIDYVRVMSGANDHVSLIWRVVAELSKRALARSENGFGARA